MTFLSTPQTKADLSLKPKMSSKKIITSVIALSAVSILSVFSSSAALANSCSKSDIDYYLQRGFTNDQVVQLCAGPAQNTSQQQTQGYQATAVQPQQRNLIREDESYLSAALDANGVSLSNQSLTLLPRECIKHGPTSGQASVDLIETICVNTKLKINFAGMKIGKVSKSLLFVRDAGVILKGNIQRELTGLSQLRRQDREAVIEKLSKTPKEVNIKIRRGIDPTAVAQRLSKYAK